jgi:hypothetical protein
MGMESILYGDSNLSLTSITLLSSPLLSPPMSLSLQITTYPTSMLPLHPCHRACCNCCRNYYYHYHYLLIESILISPPSPSSQQNSLANYGTSNRMFELSSSQFAIGLNWRFKPLWHLFAWSPFGPLKLCFGMKNLKI